MQREAINPDGNITPRQLTNREMTELALDSSETRTNGEELIANGRLDREDYHQMIDIAEWGHCSQMCRLLKDNAEQGKPTPIEVYQRLVDNLGRWAIRRLVFANDFELEQAYVPILAQEVITKFDHDDPQQLRCDELLIELLRRHGHRDDEESTRLQQIVAQEGGEFAQFELLHLPRLSPEAATALIARGSRHAPKAQDTQID